MIRRVLMVCVGNICRSPAAEVLLRQALPTLTVESAGLGTVDWSMLAALLCGSLLLAGGGEFAFVILSSAMAEGVVTDPREADVGSILGFGFAVLMPMLIHYGIDVVTPPVETHRYYKELSTLREQERTAAPTEKKALQKGFNEMEPEPGSE